MSKIPKVTVEPVGNGKYIATASDGAGNWSSSTWCNNPETAKSEALSALEYGFYGTFLQPTREEKEVSSHDYYSEEEQPSLAMRVTKKDIGGRVFVEGWIIVAFLIVGILFFILNPV